MDWRRISDISSRPRLVIDGVGRHDMCQVLLDKILSIILCICMVQGKLGNCWFVAAASVLAGVTKLWERVVVDHLDQEWDYDRPENYRSIGGIKLCNVSYFLFVQRSFQIHVLEIWKVGASSGRRSHTDQRWISSLYIQQR